MLAERVLPAAARAGLGFAVAMEPEITAPAGLALVHWQALIDEGARLPDAGASACGRSSITGGA